MLGDDYWWPFKGLFLFLFFVVIPLTAVLFIIGADGKISITVDRPQREELAACQAAQQSLIDNRDVYCVKEFGRPDNTWQWVYGTVFMIIGAVAWFAAHRLKNEAEATKAKADALLAEAEKKAAATIATVNEPLNASNPPKRRR